MDWATSTASVSPHLDASSTLHHHHVRFELSFGCAVENLIDFFLNRLRDLFLSAFLAYRAGDILDFKQVGLVLSFWLNKSSIHTVGISLAYVSVQRQFGFAPQPKHSPYA